MLTDYTASTGISAITKFAANTFKHQRIALEIDRQKKVYEDKIDITNVLSQAQEKDKRDGKPFSPDREKANHYAEHSLDYGIRTRLVGAYYLYKANEELECLRHILLALDTVFCSIGWEKASAFINIQNNTLLAMKRAEESKT